MKIIVLIIITLFVCIVLSQRIKFGNIYNSDLSVRVTSQTVNNIQFTLSYTTPPYYTNNSITEAQASNTQKQFKPRPLLFLVDTSNLIGANASAKTNTLNSFPNFTSMKLTNMLNIPTPSTTAVQASPVAGGFVTGSAGVALASDVKNLINPATVLTSSSVTITGNSITKSQAVTCTIAPSVDIVTTPLVIGRTYALGISIMNGVNLPTVTTPGVWQGTKTAEAIDAGIITMYSPLLWSGFTITNSMIISSNIMNVAIQYGVLYNDYAVAYGQL